MQQLQGWRKFDDWGSQSAIAEFLGETPGPRPVSELWFGNHPDGPTLLQDGSTLGDLIAQDPKKALGSGVLYALTDFEALIGFRVPRKARRLLEGLEGELAELLRRRLKLSTVRGGLRSLASWVFDIDSPVTPALVEEFVGACRARLESGNSPSLRADQLVCELEAVHGGDSGIILAFLMNPVSLRAGEAAYIPPRQIHAYQRGLGIEVMAASDNVIRAGLTHKHVDSAQLVEIAEFSALPPIRLAPEHPSPHSDRFLAPAQEFELTVTTCTPDLSNLRVPGEGPRIAMVTRGRLSLSTEAGECTLGRGEAVFISASERQLRITGEGELVQCSAP